MEYNITKDDYAAPGYETFKYTYEVDGYQVEAYISLNVNKDEPMHKATVMLPNAKPSKYGMYVRLSDQLYKQTETCLRFLANSLIRAYNRELDKR